MILRVVVITVAITVCFLLFSEPSFSITKEDANAQWNAVKGTNEESAFLMKLFLYEKLVGSFPHSVKERFYEIATPNDAKTLLDKLVNRGFRKKTSVLTLLKGLKDEGFTRLFEKYLYLVPGERVQRKLYNLILGKIQFSIGSTHLYYYPAKITIESGNICNLHCPLCPTGQKDTSASKGLLSFSDFKKIIEIAKRLIV